MILFEELESRTLMSVSVTAIQLTNDQNAILAAKTSYNNTIGGFGDTLVSASLTLETELPPGKANLSLGKKALAAEKKVLANYKKETAALAKDSVSLSAKAVTAGNADITTPGTKNDAKVQKAGQKLLTKVNADQAKIANDQSLLNLYTALNTIVIANPSATTFANDVHNLENAIPLNAVPNAGNGLLAAVGALGVDLGVAT